MAEAVGHHRGAGNDDIDAVAGRGPGAAEIALEVGCTPQEVEEARAARGCSGPTSLSSSPSDSTAAPLAERLGITQVQVSRLLQRSMRDLRLALGCTPASSRRQKATPGRWPRPGVTCPALPILVG